MILSLHYLDHKMRMLECLVLSLVTFKVWTLHKLRLSLNLKVDLLLPPTLTYSTFSYFFTHKRYTSSYSVKIFLECWLIISSTWFRNAMSFKQTLTVFLRLDVMRHLHKHITKKKVIMQRIKRCFSLGDDAQLQVLHKKGSAKAIFCFSSRLANLHLFISKSILKSNYFLCLNRCSL